MEIVFSLVIPMLCGLLCSKCLADLMHDIWIFRNTNSFSCKAICDNYITEHKSLVICTIWLLIMSLHCVVVSDQIFSVIVGLFAAGFLSYILKKVFFNHSDVEISQEIEDNKTNIGRASAFTYLFNYLDHVLPRIIKKIESYELKRGPDFSCDATPTNFPDIHIPKKLYVLIPKSGNMLHCDILDAADSDVKFKDNLEPVKKDKDGHKERQFHHSVYCVKDCRGTDMYFVGEFATPLTAISHVQNKCKSRHSVDQIQVFYQTLNDCLTKRRVEHGNVCHLVYYDDDESCHSHPIKKAMLNVLMDERFPTTG